MPPPDPVRAALAACPPLAGLPRAVVDSAADRLWMRTLLPNEAVYRAGDPGDAMFVVASGRIAVRLSSPDGDAVEMAAVHSGRVSRQRIQESVIKVLAAKEKVGLDRKRFVDLEAISDTVDSAIPLIVRSQA